MEVGGEKLTFNHAMVYAADVRRALGFYRDLLGFQLVDEFATKTYPYMRGCAHLEATVRSRCT